MSKSKRIEGLDCEASARAGAGLVLRAKLEDMWELREAALDFSDIEGVHKMRVASRRLRSALRDFQPYLSKPVSPRRLKAVARSLGAVRDEDVAIEMMEGLMAEADEDAKEGLERLIGERRARRDKARARLGPAISVGALGELREKFTVQLSRASAEHGAAKDAEAAKVAEEAKDDDGAAEKDDGAAEGDETAKGAEAVEDAEDAPAAARRAPRSIRFTEAGARVVRARFRELKKSAGSLYRPYDVEPLHEMRIKAKRLRYAIELFAQCWGESVAPYAAEIAKLQEYLGELHDCDVWIEDLGKRLRKRRRGAAGQSEQAAERRAAVWLLRHFTRARAKHYAKALALWDGWEAMDFESGLAASVAEARAAAESPAREQVAAEVAGTQDAA